MSFDGSLNSVSIIEICIDLGNFRGNSNDDIVSLFFQRKTVRQEEVIEPIIVS